MGRGMRDNGGMIFSMERGLKRGMMDPNIKGIMLMAKSMVVVTTIGMTVQNIMVIGKKIKLVGLDSTHG